MRSATTALPMVLLFLAVGCAASPSAQLEANKDLVRRFTEATNAADWESLAAIVAEDFTRHSAATAGPPVKSRDEFIQLQESFLVGFPDQRVTVRRLVAEGDYVAALATYSGTHTGPMGDIPATGRTIESPFLAMFRIEGNRIAELWVEWDNVAILTQLGLFPEPPPAG
ncbi:MAG: ester cyclase [Candidatus Palauibacterales bacterium]|nr:ester cyclase [Candidatus Palauibacterales bacterium]